MATSQIINTSAIEPAVIMERYESDYSEEFEEEELSSAALPSSKPSAWSLSVQPRRKARVGGGRRPGESEYGTPNRQQVVSKSRSTGAGRRARRIEPQSSRRSFQPRRLQQAKMAVAGSSPARDRQLSAMNHTLRGLQNRLSERERRLEEVCTENKLLSRLQKKQERDWGRLQRQEGELPQILRRHDQEVRRELSLTSFPYLPSLALPFLLLPLPSHY